MPAMKRCTCMNCRHVWNDLPGAFAKLTRPQYRGDITNGCPSCGGLYWNEEPQP